MPPKPSVTPDEDVKFLLTIIKLAGVGTPDWQKVADELELPSKGAAAKRFSRLPGKYGIDAANNTSEDAPSTPKKGKGQSTTKKAPVSAKKRKVQAEEEVDAEDDGEEDKVKAEVDD